MPRVKSGPAHHHRRNKVLKLAKGFRGRRKNNYRVARTAVIHALADAYKDRRRKKRDVRESGSSVWVQQHANLASPIVNDQVVDDAKVLVNRKILSNIAISEPAVFKKIVETVNKNLFAPAAQLRRGHELAPRHRHPAPPVAGRSLQGEARHHARGTPEDSRRRNKPGAEAPLPVVLASGRQPGRHRVAQG